METGDTLDHVPPQVVDFIQEHSALTIATASSSGAPHAATMIYVNDGLAVYFSTNPDTVTATHISTNPRVSFAISEYQHDWQESRGVQADGEAEVVISPQEVQRVVALFKAKYSSLKDTRTSNLSIFRVRPAAIHFVDNRGSGEVAGQTLGTGWRRSLVFNVFRTIPEYQMETVSAHMNTVRYDPDEVVVRQGTPADKFFIIADGEVVVLREDDGVTREVARLGPGQFFGETAILRDAPRNATVQAVRATTLLMMDRETFRDLVTQSFATSSDFDRVIQQRLDELSSSQAGE